jgi:hypothetical protein
MITAIYSKSGTSGFGVSVGTGLAVDVSVGGTGVEVSTAVIEGTCDATGTDGAPTQARVTATRTTGRRYFCFMADDILRCLYHSSILRANPAFNKIRFLAFSF